MNLGADSSQKKVEALKIYLDELRGLGRDLRETNAETMDILKQQGHHNIDSLVRAFQISYLAGKMNAFLQ